LVEFNNFVNILTFTLNCSGSVKYREDEDFWLELPRYTYVAVHIIVEKSLYDHYVNMYVCTLIHMYITVFPHSTAAHRQYRLVYMSVHL
jgi:hypothetical protein